MATVINYSPNVYNISENIVISINKDNLGELYVYDKNGNGYYLNHASTFDLVNFFNLTGQKNISREIEDFIMSLDARNKLDV